MEELFHGLPGGCGEAILDLQQNWEQELGKRGTAFTIVLRCNKMYIMQIDEHELSTKKRNARVYRGSMVGR